MGCCPDVCSGRKIECRSRLWGRCHTPDEAGGGSASEGKSSVSHVSSWSFGWPVSTAVIMFITLNKPCSLIILALCNPSKFSSYSPILAFARTSCIALDCDGHVHANFENSVLLPTLALSCHSTPSAPVVCACLTNMKGSRWGQFFFTGGDGGGGVPHEYNTHLVPLSHWSCIGFECGHVPLVTSVT